MDRDFQFNREWETYFTTKTLFDGNMVRIYFSRDIGTIKKLNFYGATYDIGLAIGKSKKELNNWYYSSGANSIVKYETYSKYGISVLLWAKRQIEKFIDFQRQWGGTPVALCIGGEDNRRYRVYKKGLKKLNFTEQTVRYGFLDDFQYNFEAGAISYEYRKRLVYIVED
jgi:hypothetical protein